MYNPADYDLDMDDIPLWMRPQYRGIDWAFLAVVALCVVIVLPLATRAGIPPAPEAESEIYRIIEVANSLDDGMLYPRWAPSFNYGYGSPIFNHIAPLPHYVGGLFVALIQEDAVIALKVMVIGAIFTLAVATFAFGRRRYGGLAGVWMAALMLLSPFIILSLPYLIGEVGLLWALAAMALSLWAADRVLVLGKGRDVLLLSLGSALILLAHTRIGIVCFALVLGWVVVQGIVDSKVHFYLALLGMIFGALLASFYWVPAWLESEYARWAPFNSYPNAYTVNTLFEPLPPLDRSAFNPVPDLHLGLALWVFALVGLLWLLWRILFRSGAADETRQKLAGELYFVAVALLILAWLLTEHHPSQYGSLHALRPIDVMGVLVFSGVVLSAQLMHLLESRIQNLLRRLVALCIVTVVVMVSSGTSIYVPPFLSFQSPVTLNQHFNDELRGNMLGSFREGWLLPSTVQALPPPAGELARELQNFPPNTRIRIDSPTRKSYEIESADDSEFTLLIFDYPGWEIKRNGQSLSKDNLGPSGLITVPLQAGFNRVDVAFTNTNNRLLGWGISLGAFVAVVLVTLFLERRQSRTVLYLSPVAMRQKRHRQISVLFMVIVLGGGVLIGRANPDLLTRQTSENRIAADVMPMDVLVSGILQNGISLLGYQYSATELEAASTFHLTIHWQANGAQVDPYQINILLFKDGREVERVAYSHLASWPTRRWPQNQYVIGKYLVPVPEEAGTYRMVLEIGVGTCDITLLSPCPEMARSEIYDLRGPTGQQILLPQPIIVYN